MKSARILIVEDNEAALFGYSRFLSQAGYTVQTAATLRAGRDLIGSEEFDAIILDLNLPDGSALSWISDIRTDLPASAIIVITGNNDVPTAVQAMKNGADNFLLKPVNFEELSVSLGKSLATTTLRKRDSAFQRLTVTDEMFMGTALQSAKTLELAHMAAEKDVAILIHGETGTGKGVLARWIHGKSGRSSNAFVELNCSTLKGELLRSELFGHSKGAFTSAMKDREGLVEAADGGTLFLDEIGDMDLEVQAQLLKALEEKTFRRIGENRLRTSDFRLVCATNRNLGEESQRGAFRKDLFFRISVFPIMLPPLRETSSDLPDLAVYLLQKLGCSASLPGDVLELLKRYPWPGNIRELKNMLERACILSEGKPFRIEHFSGISAGPVQPDADQHHSDGHTVWNLDQVEEAHIQKTLQAFDGDKNQACKALGISLSSLYRRLGKIPEGTPTE